MENVIIVGTGCAGLTGAIYAARANLSPLVLEGRQPGGQLTTTTAVENYPGFPEGVDGPELIMRMHQQAEKFGARFEYGTVEEFEHAGMHSRLKVDGEWRETRALIVASGASPRYLGIDRENELIGHGLTSCATCDGAFYRNVPVCVVGGGDSACEEAIFLTRFASKVYLIHRRRALRASAIMADRMLANPKIQPVWDTVITDYLTDASGEVRGVKLKNVISGSLRELEVKCVFVAIGHEPNTAPFRDKLDMDENGYLIQRNGTHTNLPGVFAAGDVADHVYRQAVTAAGEGCAAAIDAERWLAEHE
jgi:thioredoxin reductase (NADPH)